MVALRSLVLALLGMDAVRAALVCDLTGEAAPSVVTLRASKNKPASDAWIVHPDCTIETKPLAGSMGYLDVSNDDIERVDSVPTETNILQITGNPLSRGGDLSKASKLTQVNTWQFAGLILPSTVTTLSFASGQLSSLAGLAIPTQLQVLSLYGNPLQSFKGVKLPGSIKELSLSYTKLSAIDFEIPTQLSIFDVSGNAISSIQGIKLPDSLERFACDLCGLTAVRGVKWPKSLREINLYRNSFVNFEIRRSDLPQFKNSFVASISQPKCADSTAEIVVVNENRLCVIEDDRFEAIYVNGNGITPSAPSTSKSTPSPGSAGATATPGSTASPDDDQGTGTGSGPGTSTTEGSKPADSSGSTLVSDSSSSKASANQPRPSRNSTSGDATDFLGGSEDESTSSSSTSGLQPRSSRKGGSVSTSTDTVSSSSSTKMALILGVCGGCVGLIIVIGLLVSAARKRRATNTEADSKYRPVDTPHESTVNHSLDLSTSSDLSNDVRNDKALIPYHIERSDLTLGEKLAQNRSSVVYKATCQDVPVAVKKLLPGVWDNKVKLNKFMDEIRTCSRLDHHKIVGFVGISWTSIRDLSVVMELMPLGDLSTVLENQHQPPKAQDWSRPWTESQIKSKALIAQDVAEAVVYLHSFNDPILHRNLKARNVLLDSQGNAKLSGFGISRKSSPDYTMTGEIGTAAWIAPEVLRGERYDEKADVYSLAVLLVELDRCQHPYASDASHHQSGVVRDPGVSRHIKYNNTQIAVMVSSGKLRPSVSSDCPEIVALLVAQCLSFNPADRPTSMGVAYGLRQARIALEED